MHYPKPTQEGKLRAACDRCHDLKNRCVRTGGPESRCDRCERMDIDCVYRNSSRIGRPRTRRRASVASQLRPDWDHSYENESRERNKNRRQDHTQRPLDAWGSAGNANHTQVREEVEAEAEAGTERSASTGLNMPSSNEMNLLVSPQVVQHADMDWGPIDFSRHIEAVNETIHHGAAGQIPALEPFPLPDSDPDGVLDTDQATQATDKLLDLQGRLRRVLSGLDRQPSIDHVENGLEVTKSFLEILQSMMASHSLPMDPGILSTSPSPRGNGNSDATISITRLNADATNGLDFITVQQALLCYSHVLYMLDRVVDVLATDVNQVGGVQQPEAPAAISIGRFSLTSQPALNATVLMHLLIRMIHQLALLVQQLASGCKELAGRLSSPPDSAVAVETGGSPDKMPASSIAVTSHAVADLIGEREKSLLERLSFLTRGP